MNVTDYYISINAELNAVKNRVRNFIADHHWQTDGEWKESVLRTILRRHLPSNFEVGRGFVIKPDTCSSQIDVVIYDASKPVLYRDGDLLFVTSDAVRGIIEVKSKLYRSDVSAVLTKLADNAEFIYLPHIGGPNLFVGLFAYETDIDALQPYPFLNQLNQTTGGKEQRVINHISLGDSLFIRYWETSPLWDDDYETWHAYRLPSKAAGYFINNLVHFMAQDSVSLNQAVWFPVEGKEDQMRGQMKLMRDSVALPINETEQDQLGAFENHMDTKLADDVQS